MDSYMSPVSVTPVHVNGVCLARVDNQPYFIHIGLVSVWSGVKGHIYYTSIVPIHQSNGFGEKVSFRDNELVEVDIERSVDDVDKTPVFLDEVVASGHLVFPRCIGETHIEGTFESGCDMGDFRETEADKVLAAGAGIANGTLISAHGGLAFPEGANHGADLADKTVQNTLLYLAHSAKRLDDANHRSTRGGGDTTKDEAYNISNGLEDDDPPRVANLDSCGLCLLGVVENGVDLLLGDFDFHGLFVFFECKDTIEKRKKTILSQRNAINV